MVGRGGLLAAQIAFETDRGWCSPFAWLRLRATPNEPYTHVINCKGGTGAVGIGPGGHAACMPRLLDDCIERDSLSVARTVDHAGLRRRRQGTGSQSDNRHAIGIIDDCRPSPESERRERGRQRRDGDSLSRLSHVPDSCNDCFIYEYKTQDREKWRKLAARSLPPALVPVTCGQWKQNPSPNKRGRNGLSLSMLSRRPIAGSAIQLPPPGRNDCGPEGRRGSCCMLACRLCRMVGLLSRDCPCGEAEGWRAPGSARARAVRREGMSEWNGAPASAPPRRLPKMCAPMRLLQQRTAWRANTKTESSSAMHTLRLTRIAVRTSFGIRALFAVHTPLAILYTCPDIHMHLAVHTPASHMVRTPH
jgi:hypothetical protein